MSNQAPITQIDIPTINPIKGSNEPINLKPRAIRIPKIPNTVTNPRAIMIPGTKPFTSMNKREWEAEELLK